MSQRNLLQSVLINVRLLVLNLCVRMEVKTNLAYNWDPDVVYSGPYLANQTSCMCNSVTYSLLSACAHCQGRDYIQ